MNIKALKDFVAFGKTYSAGKMAELPDEAADRAIKAGWAVPDGTSGQKAKGKKIAEETHNRIK